MRGLAGDGIGAGDGESSRGGFCRWAASGTAVAGLAAFGLFAAGCSTGGTGTRDEGPARTDPVAQSPSTHEPNATSSPVKKVDAVRLILDDPKVGKRVKADLKECADDAYPIDTSYGNVTSSPVPDVVVNVLTCGDAVGIGTYVYREGDNGYENVFAAEEPAVYSTIDRGDLVVTKQVYAKGDPVSYPSGQIVITYRWTGNRFTEHDRVENEYSRGMGGAVADDPVPTAPR
ncbi:hypothetical protein ACFU5O_21670 [Streptomyces sp. NPDC057445]|uniref:hypothetical protein n=1 Tax=Streptomyces sp. NPDC057445 TaxID=3346136 RepID=UPI0036A1EC83